MLTKPFFPRSAAWLLVASLAFTSSVFAQSTTTTPDPDRQPVKRNPTGQQLQQQHGWQMFNENVGGTLKLQDDQLQRLRDVDTKYQVQYKALGDQPWTNQGYQPLTDPRNKDIQSILTPAQYSTWTRTYGGFTQPSEPAHQHTGSDPDVPTPPRSNP